MLTKDQKKQYRAIAHGLKPIVTIGGKGLSEAVMAEFERALNDHELIKIKLAVDDREERAELINTLCAEANAELVQNIGKTVVFFRAAKKPDPRLSNVLRGSTS